MFKLTPWYFQHYFHILGPKNEVLRNPTGAPSLSRSFILACPNKDEPGNSKAKKQRQPAERTTLEQRLKKSSASLPGIRVKQCHFLTR
jgi:hypothetical protein